MFVYINREKAVGGVKNLGRADTSGYILPCDEQRRVLRQTRITNYLFKVPTATPWKRQIKRPALNVTGNFRERAFRAQHWAEMRLMKARLRLVEAKERYYLEKTKRLMTK